jgi:hypothetical protein
VLWSRTGRIYVPWRDPSVGCKLSLLSDRGITTVDATVASPNDVSTANWTASPAGCGRTADTLTETTDASPVAHFLYQTVPGLVAGKAATISFELKAGTRVYALLFDAPSAANWYCYVDLSNGAIGSTSNCTATGVDVGSGWYRFTVTPTVAKVTATIGVSTSIGMGGANGWVVQGNGTGTIQIRNVQITQRNVSIWADVVTGSRLSAVQAIAASQPLWTTSDVNFGGRPTVEFGPGNYSLAGALPFDIPQPTTYYTLVRTKAGSSTANVVSQQGETTFAVLAYWSTAGGRAYASAGTNINTNDAMTGSTNYLLTTVFNGASSSLSFSDASALHTGAGNAGTNGAFANNVFRIGSGTESGAAKYFWLSTIAAYFACAGAHDLSTQARIKNWLSVWSKTVLK